MKSFNVTMRQDIVLLNITVKNIEKGLFISYYEERYFDLDQVQVFSNLTIITSL
jgi:hypothetical protein